MNVILNTKAGVSALKAGRPKTLCQWCYRIIDVSSMCESALKLLSKSEKQKQNSRCEQLVTLSSFGFGSSAGTSTCSSRNKEACVEAGTSTCSTKSPLN